MSQLPESDWMRRLADKGADADFLSQFAAKQPEHDREEPASQELDSLVSRINQLTNGDETPTAAEYEDDIVDVELADPGEIAEPAAWTPHEPTNFVEADVTETLVESLILKYLLSRGDASGRATAVQICLPFSLVEKLLRQLKQDQIVVYRDSAPASDYIYTLTDLGRERARRHNQECTYYGAAPVSLSHYLESVAAQSLVEKCPTKQDLERAFADLLINKRMLSRLGPAINSGRGMFLFGPPGNGKTSIAERVTKAFGDSVWIPKAIGIDGEIMRVFDPMVHEPVAIAKTEGFLNHSKIDRRWICIKRPTIVVGGELTMDNLEVALNTSTRISEAPLQLKSNCGTLVIDDFGRQKMSVDTLLNRWIVPLENRFDFLNMPNGKKIRVPFDQLIVFSTNLEPKDLVDDAFLRRIPYKIEVCDPTESEFRALFHLMCDKFEIPQNDAAIDYLLQTHYRDASRRLRCCHPRDLLLQIRNHCKYEQAGVELNRDTLDFAVENYFAVM